MLFLSSSRNLTLRALLTLSSNPTTLFKPPHQQLWPRSFLTLTPRRFSHSSTPIATTAREFFGSSSISVVARCFSSFSSSSSSSPSVSVADTMEWDEPEPEPVAVCTEVEDSGDDVVSDEDVKPAIPVRAYFFSTSVDLRGLLEQNRANFIQPTSRMTNYIVLKFGSTKPELIGLGASITGSDSSYMVVFQYGSIVLFNVGDHEIDGYLKIVEKHASGLLPEMRKDGCNATVE